MTKVTLVSKKPDKRSKYCEVMFTYNGREFPASITAGDIKWYLRMTIENHMWWLEQNFSKTEIERFDLEELADFMAQEVWYQEDYLIGYLEYSHGIHYKKTA